MAPFGAFCFNYTLLYFSLSLRIPFKIRSRPRAFLVVKPHKKNAMALTGLNRSEKNPQQFAQLTIDLMAIIEKSDTDSTQNTPTSNNGS